MSAGLNDDHVLLDFLEGTRGRTEQQLGYSCLYFVQRNIFLGWIQLLLGPFLPRVLAAGRTFSSLTVGGKVFAHPSTWLSQVWIKLEGRKRGLGL